MLQNRGFALPTVLISSIIMMMVLLSGLTALSSSSVGIRSQYVEQLNTTASEAGMTLATACLSASNGVPTWSNSTPLKPNTNCSGAELVSCPATSTDSRCYVASSANYRSSFTVTYTTENGKIKEVISKGITGKVRSTNQVVVGNDNFTVVGKYTGAIGSAFSSASKISVSPSSHNCEYTYGAANNCYTKPTPGGICAVVTNGEVVCAGQPGHKSGEFGRNGIFCNSLVALYPTYTQQNPNCQSRVGADMSVWTKNWSVSGQPFAGKKAVAVSATPGTLCNNDLECYMSSQFDSYGGQLDMPSIPGAVCIVTDDGKILCAGQAGITHPGELAMHSRCNPLVNATVPNGGSYTHEYPCDVTVRTKDWSAAGQPFAGKKMVSVHITPALNNLGISSAGPSYGANICGLTDAGEIICTGRAHFAKDGYCNSLVTTFTKYVSFGSSHNGYYGTPNYTLACADAEENLNTTKNWSAAGQPFAGMSVGASGSTASPSEKILIY
jgi:hypothetical protein